MAMTAAKHVMYSVASSPRIQLNKFRVRPDYVDFIEFFFSGD